VDLANFGSESETCVLKSCSSCWSLYLLRAEFLSALIHSPPLSGSPSQSFKGVVVGHPSDGENLKTSKIALEGLVSLVIK
jgi:hypothetical protein